MRPRKKNKKTEKNIGKEKKPNNYMPLTYFLNKNEKFLNKNHMPLTYFLFL